MSGLAQSTPIDLTPDLAEKLRSVEQEFDRIERASATRRRWFLLGLIPKITQGVCFTGIFLAALSILQFYFRPTDSTTPVDTVAVWLLVYRVGSGILGCAFTLLLATWAARYCEAKANGKL